MRADISEASTNCAPTVANETLSQEDAKEAQSVPDGVAVPVSSTEGVQAIPEVTVVETKSVGDQLSEGESSKSEGRGTTEVANIETQTQSEGAKDDAMGVERAPISLGGEEAQTKPAESATQVEEARGETQDKSNGNEAASIPFEEGRGETESKSNGNAASMPVEEVNKETPLPLPLYSS